MKRISFLKTLSVLPFGVIAGNKIIESIGSSEPVNAGGLSYPVSADYNALSNATRKDLVELFMKKTDGQIGNTKIYAVTLPVVCVEYQNKNVIAINDIKYNTPNSTDEVKGWPIVAKTWRSGNILSFQSQNNEAIVSSVIREVKNIITEKKPDAFFIYDVLLTPTFTDADTFETIQGVMFRGAISSFEMDDFL